MPSTLQSISWSPSTRRMGLDLVPPLSTCEPPSLRSLMRMTQLPSARTLGVLDHARGVRRRGGGFAVPFMTAGGAFPFLGKLQNLVCLAHRAGGLAHKPAAYPVSATEHNRAFGTSQWRMI